MPPELATFLVTITALTLLPGADTLMVVRNTLRGGPKDGTLTSLGVCCGLFVHATLSAVGLSVLVMTSPWLYGALQWAGAAYLIWLGVSNLRCAFVGYRSQQVTASRPVANLGQAWREGFMSNVLNPKTIAFYMALLPQFVDPAYALVQSLMLASIHFVIALLWQGLVTLGVGRARVWLTHPRVRAGLDASVGSLLVVLGGALGFSRA